MNKADAATLAQSLLDLHGFENLTLTFSRSKRALGRCFFERISGQPTRIDLSSYWVEHLDKEQVTDTILHEIAHAKAGHKAGHGRAWKAAAIAVGANPKRTADLPENIAKSFGEKHSNYVAVCNGCEQHVYFERLGKVWREGRYRCSHCKGHFTVYSNR